VETETLVGEFRMTLRKVKEWRRVEWDRVMLDCRLYL